MSKIDEVLIALRRVIRATDLHSKHLAKTVGLTSPQILLMQAIQNHSDATIGKLASEISLSQATVTTIIDRLEKRNFLIRERSQQDKRKVKLLLTDEGLATLASAPTPLQEQFSNKFSKLEDWEQTLIISSLQRIATMMDAEDIDASPFLDVGTIDRQNLKPNSN